MPSYQAFKTQSIYLILALFTLLVLVACSDNKTQEEVEWKSIGLPVLSGTVELSVAVVNNPRFPRLPEEQVPALLERTREMTYQQFGTRITFSKPANISIDHFFDYLTPLIKQKRASEIVDVHDISDETFTQMQQSIFATLENYSADRTRVIEYARPYLNNTFEGDEFLPFSHELISTLVTRLEYWQQQKAPDGEPILNNTPYNEWVWWDSIGYGAMPYDVVITNQLVASAELYAMDVHSAIRGGITAGTTSYSKNAILHAYSWVTLYPLLNDSELLIKLRGDAHYTPQQVVNYGAALLTHELGHLLLHLGHPFGDDRCIMSPMPLLKYRNWYEGFDPARCALRSQEQMTPGVANIEYRTDL